MEPKTRLEVTKKQANAIREVVKATKYIGPPYGNLSEVRREDAKDVLELFLDERVSGDVYTLPRPFSLQSVAAYIEGHMAESVAGEGLLMCSRNENGQIISLVDIQFWPELSACEFGGVIAYAYQSQSFGSKGIVELCNWVFEVVGIKLLVMTTSLKNVRSQKILTRIGFTQMGEIESVRPDGQTRRSLYWELEKD